MIGGGVVELGTGDAVRCTPLCLSGEVVAIEGPRGDVLAGSNPN